MDDGNGSNFIVLRPNGHFLLMNQTYIRWPKDPKLLSSKVSSSRCRSENSITGYRCEQFRCCLRDCERRQHSIATNSSLPKQAILSSLGRQTRETTFPCVHGKNSMSAKFQPNIDWTVQKGADNW